MQPADLDIAVRAGRLSVEGCDANELAERFGTPVYVVSAGTLRRNVAQFTEAWSAAWREGPFQLLPALKGQVYKPGVPLADLLAIDPGELAPYVDLAGVHQHAARHSAALGFWEAIATATVETIAALRDGWHGWTPREIDLGGGFPSSLDGVGGQIERVARARDVRPVSEYAAVTTDALRTAAAAHGLPLQGVLLEIEPGRALFADTGIHLARVTRVKRQAEPMPWAWVEVDTADVFLSDVVTEHTRFTAVVADRADAPPVQHADVVGCSCNWDQLIEQEELPEVATGDVIAFLGTGCYEEVSAANFNALPRPGTVLVQGAGAAVVRRAETLSDVLSRDV